MQMVQRFDRLRVRLFRFAVPALLLVGISPLEAASIPGVGEVPEIPAFLPTMETVAATQPLPVDGTWRIREIAKTVRIDRGRIYAVDSWTHMFVLQVQPGMVVVKDFQATGPGEYAGFDLPLQGTGTYKLTKDRTLSVFVQGLLGPVRLTLMPLQLDNPLWLDQALAEAGLAPASPAYGQPVQQPPAYQPPAYQPPAYQPPAYQPPPQQAPPNAPPAYPPPGQQPPAAQPVQMPITPPADDGGPAVCEPVYRPETDDFGCPR